MTGRLKNIISKITSKLAGDGSTVAVFKNMGMLATGSVAAKIIGFATYPVITRIYSPSDFGVLAVFAAAVSILVPFATLRYSVTIPLPKNDGLALNLLLLGFGLAIGFALLLSAMFLIWGQPVFAFFNMPEIAQFWWLLVLGVCGAAFYELMTKWATRKRKFAPVAKTSVWQSLLGAFTKIGLGFAGLKPSGLLFGAVVTSGGGVFSLFRYFFSDFRENFKAVRLQRMKFLFRYYRDLPLFRLPSQFLLIFSGKVPVLYFAYQFGSEPTGQLGLALMVVGIPMGLIGRNTAQAYYGEIASIGAKKKEEILDVTKSVTKKLLLMSFIPALILVLFSPFLFSLIFGAEWEQAGIFTSILAFYLFVQFVTSPLVNVFTVYNMERKFLEINIVRTVVMVVVFGTAILVGFDVYETLILYTVLLSGHYLFTGWQVMRVIKLK